MAEFVMQVFHYQDTTSDKLWAVCEDGARVLTHWGRRDGRKLQGGGPIALNNQDPYTVMERKILEKQAEGYVAIGTRLVRDGKIIEHDGPPVSPSNVPEHPVLPEAYTAFRTVTGWKGKIEGVFQHAPAYQVRWEDHPDAPGSEQLIIAFDDGEEMTTRISASSEVRVRAMQRHGPRGLLAVLAIAKALQVKAFDADGEERNGNWLTSHPERFESDRVSLECSRSEAGQLGVIFQIQFKTGRGLGLFA